MSLKKPRESKGRPFPWPCADCYTLTVVPTVIDYTTKIKHDGVVHELHLPALEVPRCQTCGETVITTAVDERINDALRSHLRLLRPDQMTIVVENDPRRGRVGRAEELCGIEILENDAEKARCAISYQTYALADRMSGVMDDGGGWRETAKVL